MSMMEESLLLRKEFNDKLIEVMMKAMIDNDFIISISHTVLYICFAFGLFALFSKLHTKNFVTDFTKWIIKAWIVLAVVNPTGTNFPFSGNKNLAIYTYDEFSAIFNDYAKKMGSETDLAKNIANLTTFQYNITEAQRECKPGDQTCWKGYLSGDIMQTAADKAKAEAAEGKKTGIDKAVSMLNDMINAVKKSFANPSYFIFPFLMQILAIIQGFVMLFMLLGLGLITAFSLMMVTVITPFALLDRFTGQVVGAYKNVLACALFQFTGKLILWISIIVTGAIHDATQSVFIRALVNESSNGDYSFGSGMSILLMANFGAVFVVLFMQIIAVTKIPKISRDIMNLSLSSIVNIGDALLGAALGISGIAEMGAGGMAGVAAGGAVNKTASVVEGESAITKTSSNIGSGGSGGAGGSSFNPSIVNSLSRDPLVNQTGGGESLNSSALTGAKSDAKSVLKKDKKNVDSDVDMEDPDKGFFERNRKDIGGAIRTVGNSAISVAGTGGNMLWDSISAGMGQGDGLSTIKKGMRAAGNQKNLREFGGSISKGASVLRDTSKKIINRKQQIAKTNLGLNSLVNSEKGLLTSSLKKELIDKADNIALGTGSNDDYEQLYKMQNKYDTSAIDDQLKDANLNDDYKKFAKNQNQKNDLLLNGVKEQFEKNGELDFLTKKRLNYQMATGNMSADSLKNKMLMKKSALDQISKQENEIKRAVETGQSTVPLVDSNGLYQLNEDQSVKTVSIEEARTKKQEILNSKDSQDGSVLSKIQEQNGQELQVKINNLFKKFKDGKLSNEDRKNLIEEISFNKDSLIGKKDELAKIEEIYGGAIDVSHLKQSNNDIKTQAMDLIKDSSKMTANVYSLDKEKNIEIYYNQVQIKKGNSVYFEKQAKGLFVYNEDLIITSKEDLLKIKNAENRKIVAEHLNVLNRIEANPELKAQIMKEASTISNDKDQRSNNNATENLTSQLSLLKLFKK